MIKILKFRILNLQTAAVYFKYTKRSFSFALTPQEHFIKQKISATITITAVITFFLFFISLEF
jgi:hypothetical protein